MNGYEMLQVVRSACKKVVRRTRNRLIKGLKRFLRRCYRLGAPMCIFIGSVSLFIVVGLVLIFTIPRHRKAEAAVYAAQIEAMATPVPTPSPTVSPTPSPTPDPAESWIKKGEEGEDVVALQTRLMDLGYLGIDEPTSTFGNATLAAVKLFQRQHGLQMDGIDGPETHTLLFAEDAKPYVMTEGTEGDDIKSFQEQLVELGYLESNQVTGYYGTDTVNAVTKFQRRNHLTKDGKAGEQTLETINSADARVSYTKELEIAEEKKKAAAAARAQSAEGRIDKLISVASKQIGKPYILGAKGPNTYDCSGLVYYCLRQAGVYTRRLNAAGFSRTGSWEKISSMSALKRGDLIFFRSDGSSSVGHVGIYIGSGTMIDASSSNGKVMKRSCTGSWSRRNFVCGRRPIK